jgi:NADPH:quinone reductase-like Zn-dependent oxidoreductase
VKAAIYETYGPPEVLKIGEVERPSIQDAPDRILVKVHYAAVNPLDYLSRKGYWPTRFSNGLLKPKVADQILGIDVAGTVEAVGTGVTRFKPGDRVFGLCYGSHAEYVRPREKGLSLMPANVTLQAAAAVPCAALTALQALRKVANVQPGQRVLIYGASGGIGHFAVQLAKHFGAEVTAVCSTKNLDWVKALGADHMIDYTQSDFARNGQQYDLILDAVGKRTYSSCKPSLTANGIYITEHPLKPAAQIPQWIFSMVLRDPRFKTHLTEADVADMELLRDLLEQGRLKPVVEKCYPLDQIVTAHRHVENGHTSGKVVIEVVRD